jgi:hypothetical protein
VDPDVSRYGNGNLTRLESPIVIGSESGKFRLYLTTNPKQKKKSLVFQKITKLWRLNCPGMCFEIFSIFLFLFFLSRIFVQQNLPRLHHFSS